MSRKLYYYFLFLLLCSTFSLSWEEKEDQILNEDLSKEEHYQKIDDNEEYDHDEILDDETQSFDNLSPEERKMRLASIVDRIDTDKDNFVTQDELQMWIKYIQRKPFQDDVDNQWESLVPPNKNSLAWDDYRKSVYGFMYETDFNKTNEHAYLYFKTLKRDQRRWQMSDRDHDGRLAKDEFASFLHPQLAEHMLEILVAEAIEDIDKDNDGKVSLEEYIGDMYEGGEDEGEPDWVRNEREQFSLNRDRDGDGFMDQEELRAWIVPQVSSDFDDAEAEALHLLFELDSNVDLKLTKEEILDKYELFLNSPATDFGDALTRGHDEL